MLYKKNTELNNMSSFIESMFDSGKYILQDMVTPDPEMDQVEAHNRRNDRHEVKKRMNSTLSNYTSVDDPNWEKEEWTDNDGNVHNGTTDLKFVNDSWKLLNGKLELAYDELEYDDKFIDSAQKIYQAEHGIKYTGNKRDLVEKTFQKFNWMELNVGVTGAQLLTDKMFYDDFDEDSLKSLQHAYSTFVETDATGYGSRAFQNQAWDFIKSTAGDPLSWPYSIRKFMKLGSNVIKLGTKKTFQKQISDRIAGLIAASVYTGTYSGAMSTNIQNISMDLGMQEDFSYGRLATSMGIGSVLPPAIVGGGWLAKKITEKTSKALGKINPHLEFTIPLVSKDLSQTIGNFQRKLLHPYQAWYGRGMVHPEKGTIKGKKAAILGVMSDMRDTAIAQSSKQSVKEFSVSLNDGVIHPMNEAIKNGYKSLSYRDINMADAKLIEKEIDKIIKTHASDPNFKLEGEIKQLLDLILPHLSDDYASSIVKAQVKYTSDYEKWNKYLQKIKSDKKDLQDLYPEGHQFSLQTEKYRWQQLNDYDSQWRYHLTKKPIEEAAPLPQFLKAMDGKEKVADISEAFNRLRTVLHNANQSAAGAGKHTAAQAYKELRIVINNAQRNQLATKGDKMAWDALNKSTEDFKTLLKETKIGKDFAVILEKMKQIKYNRTKTNPEGVPDPNHSLADGLEQEVDMVVTKLLEKIIDTKDSYPLLLQFEKALNSIDHRTNGINNALRLKNKPDLEKEMYAHYTQKNFKEYPELKDINISKFPINDYPQRLDVAISKLAEERLIIKGENDSYPALREIIKSRFGENLKQDISQMDQGGLTFIGKVLDRENGFDLIKHLYPEYADDLVKIQSLKRFLEKKVLKKHSQSVIVNMTFASLAMEAGQMMGGRLVAAGATLGTMGQLQGWRNLIGNRKFQQHMVDILNNEGRITTKTAESLRQQFGFDAAGIRGLQDDLTNMIITMPVIKNKEDIKASVEKRMLQ